MEPTNYIYNTLEEANAFIALVNTGEGFPVPGGDTLIYCEATPILENGIPISWGVIKDSVTEKYHL